MKTKRRGLSRPEPVELKIAKTLKKKKKTLVLAESCTGGLASHRITNIPGSSEYFKGGVIAYSDKVKISVLDVSPEIIKKHGAVSREAARAMAEGAGSVLKADMAAAVTGIAGPGGGTTKKPVGLAYIAFTSNKISKTEKVLFKGGRMAIKEQFSQAVLEMIWENI